MSRSTSPTPRRVPGRVMRCSRCWPGCARRSRTNWDQWKTQAARHALTINWYYADDRGNIGYAHPSIPSASPATIRACRCQAPARWIGTACRRSHQSAGVQPAPGLHRQLEQPAHARLSVHRPVRHRLGPGRPLRRDRDAPEGHDRAGRPGRPATDVGPDPRPATPTSTVATSCPSCSGGGRCLPATSARGWWPGWRPGTA